MNNLRKFIRLPMQEKAWLIVCIFGSLLALFTIHIIKINRLGKFLGEHLDNKQICVISDKEQVKKAKRIGQIMEAVGKRVPWKCACLSKALCVKWLLNQHKIPSVFYLGAKFDASEGKQMKAHAWVNVRGCTVIGAPQHRDYTVTTTFVTFSFS